MKVRIKFRKYGVMKFIGHLDVMRYFQKVMRRADIPIAFTGGYSPHMIMSFAQPLGVGITSDGEYFDIELKESVSSEDAVSRMNQVMAEGIEVTSFMEIPDDKKFSGMTITAAASYNVYLPVSVTDLEVTKDIPEEWEKKILEFLSQEQIIVWKKTKKSEKEVDIRPMIYEMRVEKDHLYMLLAAGSEQNLKPDLVMETFLDYMGIADIPLAYHRVEMYARKGCGEEFVPLEKMGKIIIKGDEQ